MLFRIFDDDVVAHESNFNLINMIALGDYFEINIPRCIVRYIQTYQGVLC